MIKRQGHIRSLNVDESKVSIDVDINWQGIEINYVGNMNITTLLPNEYMVANGNGKILIIKMGYNDDSTLDLFAYTGSAMITKCIIATKELTKHRININKLSLQVWNSMKGSIKGGSLSSQTYESIGEFWEKLDFDGNNKKMSYIYQKNVYDKETKSFTKTKEIRKK